VKVQQATATQRNTNGRIQRRKKSERTNGLRLGITNNETPKEKEEELVEMMHRRKLDIIGVSETREKESKRRMIHDNYLFIGCGDPLGRHRLGITIKEELAIFVVKYELINNKMVKVCLTTSREKLAIIQVYAPQQGRPKKEKEEFFESLQCVVDACDGDEEMVVIWDLNGHMGRVRHGYESSMGHFGIGTANEEGRRVLDFCVRNNLRVMNTHFQHRGSHKYTWYGWNTSKMDYDRQTMIDLFLVGNGRKVVDVKAIPSVSSDSDHRLVRHAAQIKVWNESEKIEHQRHETGREQPEVLRIHQQVNARLRGHGQRRR